MLLYLTALIACSPSEMAIHPEDASCPSLDPEEIWLSPSDHRVERTARLVLTADAVVTSVAWVPMLGGGDPSDVLVPDISYAELLAGSWLEVTVLPGEEPLEGHVLMTTTSSCDLATYITTETP